MPGEIELPVDNVVVYTVHNKLYAREYEDCDIKTGQVDWFERAIGIEGRLSEEQCQRMPEITGVCSVHKFYLLDSGGLIDEFLDK